MEKVITYVDIESLLDLRQGFLVTKGKSFEEVLEYISSEDYNLRDIDELMEFDPEEYRAEVDAGNIELLKNSILTYLPGTITGKILNVGVKQSIDGRKYMPELWVNIHPFKLSKEEIQELKECIFNTIGVETLIEIVNIPLEKLPPSYIKEAGIETCYIYNYTKWIDLHIESLPKVSIVDVDFIFPPLYNKRPNEDELDSIKEQGFDDGFSYLQFFFGIFARFTFLPIPYYSNFVIGKKIIEEMEASWLKEHEEKVKEYDNDVEEYLDGYFNRQH